VARNIDGASLALGVTGLLAVASAVARRGGSRDQVSDHVAGRVAGALRSLMRHYGGHSAIFQEPKAGMDRDELAALILNRSGLSAKVKTRLYEQLLNLSVRDLRDVYRLVFPVAAANVITLHQWVRGGKPVLILRTDAPSFGPKYAAAKRKYGLPTHSGPIGAGYSHNVDGSRALDLEALLAEVEGVVAAHPVLDRDQIAGALRSADGFSRDDLSVSPPGTSAFFAGEWVVYRLRAGGWTMAERFLDTQAGFDALLDHIQAALGS